MSRTLSTTISTAIVKNATQPAYLLRLGFSADSPMTEIRATTWGSDITWNAETWDASGIEVKNLSRTACTLEFPIGTIGAGYSPDMMRYDGSTGYYSKTSVTTAGDDVTGIARFSVSSFAGAGTHILRVNGPSFIRLLFYVNGNDHANVDWRDKIGILIQDSAGATLVRATSTASVTDGNLHTFFVSFDGSAGTLQFVLDGDPSAVNAGATGHEINSGTLETGSGNFQIGASIAGPTAFFNGDIGFVGHREVYLTNWSDFMTGSAPKALDEFTWTEWGGQPLFWNDYGGMEVNQGSAGNMTKNGMITRVDLSSVDSLDPWLPIVMADGVRGRSVSIYQHYTDETSSPASDAVLMFTGVMDAATLTDKIRVTVIEKSRSIPFPPESIEQPKFNYLLPQGTIIGPFGYRGQIIVVR